MHKLRYLIELPCVILFYKIHYECFEQSNGCEHFAISYSVSFAFQCIRPSMMFLNSNERNRQITIFFSTIMISLIFINRIICKIRRIFAPYFCNVYKIFLSVSKLFLTLGCLEYMNMLILLFFKYCNKSILAN
jgi:hypothetical protein